MVCISTALSVRGQEEPLFQWKTAAAMMAEMGVSNVKFFPIQGDARLEEFGLLREPPRISFGDGADR